MEFSVLSDQAIGEIGQARKDSLGFKAYASVIANALTTSSGSFTVGVFGEWGTGKTSLLRLIEHELRRSNDALPVWFNAWMFEKDEHPIVPLIATIIRTIESSKGTASALDQAETRLINALRAIAYGYSAKAKIKLPGFAELEASFVAKDMIEREAALNNDPLLARSLYYNSIQRLESVSRETPRKLVILIDDLDRCFPDSAIQLLESIKLVFSQPGFCFVLAVARSVLEGYLKHRYLESYGIASINGARYLDKIVQLAFPIPPHNLKHGAFARSLLGALPAELRPTVTPVLSIIGPACAYNPRQTVRYVNNLLVDLAIARIQNPGTDAEALLPLFAVTRGLQQSWQDVFDTLRASNSDCETLAQLVQNDLTVREEELEDGVVKAVLLAVRGDKDLLALLRSNAGQVWLRQHEQRQDAIVFLSTQRNVGEEDATGGLASTNMGRRRRVYQVARDLQVTGTELAKFLGDMGIPIKSHMTPLEPDAVALAEAFFPRSRQRRVPGSIDPISGD